ncbi:magnesium ion transporter [Nowakowskiella sp. JEL0407]|nr:magnesium ion transporter [Nowakowskiella sp. JEL0407]
MKNVIRYAKPLFQINAFKSRLKFPHIPYRIYGTTFTEEISGQQNTIKPIDPVSSPQQKSLPHLHLEDIELEITEPTPSTPQKNLLGLTAIILDDKGNVKPLPVLKKSELCEMFSLLPRDIRKLGATSFSNVLPAILVRDRTILVNLEHVKALITASSVVLFDPSPDTAANHNHAQFTNDLQRKLKSTEGFYEFRALEAILVHVINALEHEQEQLLPKISDLLDSFGESLNPDKLQELLNFRRQLTTLKHRVESITEVVGKLLKSDEDLASMYLQSKVSGHPRKISDDHEIEEFTEYLKEMSYSLTDSLTNIQSTETVTTIIQDDHRNRLMKFELLATLTTVSLSAGLFVPTIFGMNINSGLEDVTGSFPTIAIISFLFLAGSWRMSFRMMNKIKPWNAKWNTDLKLDIKKKWKF